MALILRISGRVQGVGFRYWVAREAERLGIDGWVRNCRDGTVEALISGDEDSVRRMVTRCHDGPPVAHVTELVESPAPDPEDTGFRILPTAP